MDEHEAIILQSTMGCGIVAGPHAIEGSTLAVLHVVEMIRHAAGTSLVKATLKGRNEVRRHAEVRCLATNDCTSAQWISSRRTSRF